MNIVNVVCCTFGEMLVLISFYLSNDFVDACVVGFGLVGVVLVMGSILSINKLLAMMML